MEFADISFPFDILIFSVSERDHTIEEQQRTIVALQRHVRLQEILLEIMGQMQCFYLMLPNTLTQYFSEKFMFGK